MFLQYMVKGREGSASNQGYDIRRLGRKLMGEFFVVGYQMRNVHITVVLLYKNVLSNLVSVFNYYHFPIALGWPLPVDESIVKSKLEDEFTKLGLYLSTRILICVRIRREYAQRVH